MIPYSKKEFEEKWDEAHFFKNSRKKIGVAKAILNFDNQEVPLFELLEKADIYAKKYSKKKLKTSEVISCLTMMKIPKFKKNKVDYVQIKFKNS